MDAAEVLRDALSRIGHQVRDTVTGLTSEHLAFRPHEDANSIAWLVWHIARVCDDHMSEIAGQEQAWVADGWSKKFGMEPDPHNQGTGHTAEQVAGIKPDGDLLVGYAEAALTVANRYVVTADPEDLDRIIDRRWDPPVTVGARIVSVINDGTEHAGQAAYLRGLIEQRRWMPY